MNHLARTAIELRDLVERFASLSEGAMRATATADTAVLAATLDARDLVLARATAMAADLTARRRALPVSERNALEEFLRPVRRAAEHAARVNERLQAQAGATRLELGRQVEQLHLEADAATAYHAAPARRPGTLDTVR